MLCAPRHRPPNHERQQKQTTECEQIASHSAPSMTAQVKSQPMQIRSSPARRRAKASSSIGSTAKPDSGERVIFIQNKPAIHFLKHIKRSKTWPTTRAKHPFISTKNHVADLPNRSGGEGDKAKQRQRLHIDHEPARIAAIRVNPQITHYVTMSYWLPGARHRSPTHASKSWSTPQHGLTVHCDMDMEK